MDINRTTMDALFTGYKIAYKDAFTVKSNEFQTKLGLIVNEVPSGTSIEEFPFLEQFGGMREFIGPRQVQNFASKKLQVTSREFEQTIGIPRKDVVDSNQGALAYQTIAIAQMGAHSGNLAGDVTLGALVGNGNWIDDAAFFGTTRKYGKNTISNKSTSALSETEFNTAYLAMLSYKGHGNVPMRVKPTHLFVGPKNRVVAWNILKNQFNYNGSDKVQIQNVNQNLVDIVVLPELIGDYDDYWFLAAAGDVVKPMVLVNREAPTLTRKDRLEDDNVFMENKFLYGTYARCEAALVMPHLIYAGIL